MVTLHKLSTATPISAKLHSRIGKPIDIDVSSSTSSYDECSSPEPKIPVKRKDKRVINECGAFEWCEEFDDIFNDTHSEMYTIDHPYMNVLCYSKNFDKTRYQEKYDCLSVFMDLKATNIRSISKHITPKEPKSNKSKELKPRASINLEKMIPDEERSPRRIHKANSYNPDEEKSRTINRSSHITRAKSTFSKRTKNKTNDLIGYIDPIGVFLLDLNVEGIELCSSSLTENVGFFDKITFDLSFREWNKNINTAFEIHKKICRKAVKNKSRSYASLWAGIINWKFFDSLALGYRTGDIVFT